MPFVSEGTQFCRKRGNRREVLDRVAYCTSGGLTFDCLEEKNGKIISKRRSQMGRERYAARNPFKAENPKVDVEPKKAKKSAAKPKKAVAQDVEDENDPVTKKNVSRQPRVPVVRRRRGRGRRRRRV